MNILLDTHCWLWWIGAPERLNDTARLIIADRRNRPTLSAASSWEIAVKVALGKLKLPFVPKDFIPTRLARDGIMSLPIQHAHALQVAELPTYHRDPFDRMLIAQAQVEDWPLMTADKLLTTYDVKVIWAGQPGQGPSD